MSESPCPFCYGRIAESATRCQHCHADWIKRSWVSRIGTFRDFIALPTAIIALIIALKDPIADYYMKTFDLDGAKIDGYAVGFEVLNNFSEQTTTAVIGRFSLTNNGKSPAAISANFRCTGDPEVNKFNKFVFIPFSKTSRKQELFNIKAGENLILDACLTSWTDQDLFSNDKINTCRIFYSDKYQANQGLELDFKPQFLSDPSFTNQAELCS